MITTLAFRNFVFRPWRTALLFFGYSVGVTVMIVLLSIGEALISQARDEKLVGGGEITVLPEGLDVEVMKTGGLGGLFFSIPNARFVYLQLLAAPRLADAVRAVAPQIEGKLVYLRTPDGREIPVRASGEIPSAAASVGAAPELAAGRWADDASDRGWASPEPAALKHAIDHFHLPPPGLANPESWAEWHYFNVLSADRRRWAFISYIVAGQVPDGRWGGQLLVTVHEEGRPARRFTAVAEPRDIRFSTTDANLVVGAANTVTVTAEGNYQIRARAREEGGARASLDLDLLVTPTPRAYFPGASLAGGDFASGYAVAGLRADATGSLCVAGRCERFDGAQSYHDHNWGVWRGVSWEWGAVRAGRYALLYGRVQPPDSSGAGSRSPLFVYLVDSLGFRALFRPRAIAYTDARTVRVGRERVRVPATALLYDVRGADTLRLELVVEDAVATDTRGSLIERGETEYARALPRPYFVQMKGRGRLSGRVGGQPIAGEGTGFFETYR